MTIPSIRQIWYIRKKHLVHTRKNESELNVIVDVIKAELNESGSMLGYRLMWIRLRTKYLLNVRRDTVMMLLRLMDPVGTSCRKQKRLSRRCYRSPVSYSYFLFKSYSFLCQGPNFIWHMDGYDKLKPFGITIHGCIDG